MHRHAYCGLARKNQVKAEASSSLRARKLLNGRLRVCLRARFGINESKQTLLNSSLQKAAEFRRRFAMARPFAFRTRRSSKSGGGFRRSRRILLPQPASLTISKDLRAMRARDN